MADKQGKIRAAQYVRMSTERQVYSTANQADRIASYALVHGFDIVRTYADEGRSGLHLKGRSALQQLLADALSGSGGFDAILVYDVSRWGRFQDTDESAHYEFICRNAGVQIHYCAEMFANDGSLTATILKNMKRVMAGEFSRELSAKVWASQSRLAAQGYKMGGYPTYGLQRLLIDAEGKPRAILKKGEHKIASTDRVVFVPGSKQEIAIVRRIFRLSAYKGMSDKQIANLLNAEGVPSSGKAWTREIILTLLRSEKYIGTAVYNRVSSKLTTKTTLNPRDQWIRKERAFPAIVDRKTFALAQEVRKNRHVNRLTDAQLLDDLRKLLSRHKRLSSRLIMACKTMADTQTYQKRFGSLDAAYALVGYQRWNLGPAPEHQLLIARGSAFATQVGVALRHAGARVRRPTTFGLFTVDDRIRIATTVCKYTGAGRGSYWEVRLNGDYQLDYVLAALMKPQGSHPSAYVLIPSDRFPPSGRMTIKDGPNRAGSFVIPELASLYAAIRGCDARMGIVTSPA